MAVEIVHAPHVDSEAVYDDLLAHVAGDRPRRGPCPQCRPWLDRLWEARRLCPIGRGMVELYARAVLAERARSAEPAEPEMVR